ncbi:MAG: S8 family serine peptidase [Planctomycetota bacterium]
MAQLRLRGLGLACALASLALAQDPVRISPATLAPVLDGSPAHGLPGKAPGTERWIVDFRSRSFDLDAFRTAIAQRRPDAEVAAIVADLERRVKEDQREFVRAVEGFGGKVTEQWWIVNAAAVEIAPDHLDALRALPGVDFVQPDMPWDLAIRVSTNALNHNADAVQALGLKGLGATAGIMDTGQDSDMNGTGRPHRVYYVNGDPNNLSGGGIGGSRLRINRQIGAMSADDTNGHGTGVASIVAGANWGTGGADDGHAPLAGIAGYAIANQVSGGASSSSTMASAWQSMAADRATYNIVAANLSYGGSPNPRETAQQALDSAALNADIMICVAAGNNGPTASSTSGSQSAANGLAVAAIETNSHAVASFSTRGPVNSDLQRYYPDISGCGVNTVMAARNNEAGDFTASGTSMASPQVCGAATLLRGTFPVLTALQTKAVLLASSIDIASANAGLDRNAFGMGMSHDLRAYNLAAANHFGGSALTTANATHTFTLPAQADHGYAVAIAWHRLAVGSSQWSNLDLDVLDPNGVVIASSTTTRNLYEMVRFTTSTTGNYTIRTRLVSISGGTSQPFAFAWMESPVGGRFESYGAGCVGSGPIPSQCAAVNAGGGTLAGVTRPSEVAYDLTTTTPLTIQGFEVFSASNTGSPVTVNAAIYGVTGIEPVTTPLATTTVTIGTTPGFYRGTFAAPVNIPLGRFWVGVDHGAQTTLTAQIVGGSVAGAYERGAFGTGTWTRSTAVTTAAMHAICALQTAAPSLAGNGIPLIGRQVQFNLSQARPGSPGILFYGFSETSFGGTPLPLLLDGIGATGCSLLTSSEISQVLFTGASGQFSTFFAIPADPALVAARFYSQCAIVDPAINTLGMVFSNGLRMVIGE